MTLHNPLINKLIGNKDRQLTLLQFPNVPLWVWIVGTILSRVFKQGASHTLFVWIAFLGLIVWAGLELFKGDNYFRKILGGIVIVVSLYNRIK